MNPTESSIVMSLADTEEQVALNREIVLDLSHVDRAYTDGENRPNYRVVLRFTDEGTKKFRAITRENIRKRIGVIVAGELTIAPYIMVEIRDGRTPIMFGLPEQRADAMVNRINEAIDGR